LDISPERCQKIERLYHAALEREPGGARFWTKPARAMPSGPISSTTPSLASLALAGPKPTKIEDAAQQFESLLIGQMLRSARESGSGGLNGDDADSESSTMMDVAEQQFSQLLAHHGGIGLTNLVVQGLKNDR